MRSFREADAEFEAREAPNVELGDVVTIKREPASYGLFRRDGRFAEMVQAEVAGRFEAPIYGRTAGHPLSWPTG